MPRPKYISTLELVVHTYHEEKDGSDISVDNVVRSLQRAIEDIKDAGTPKAWMDVIYTEET